MQAACWLIAHISESPLVVLVQLLATERAMAEIHVDLHRLALVSACFLDGGGVPDLGKHVWLDAKTLAQSEGVS